jgi:hypothetical protein
MVPSYESSTNRGAFMHHGGAGSGASAALLMATSLVSVETREVVRCEYCRLMQYRTSNSLCRRCRKPLDMEEPVIGSATGDQPARADNAEAGHAGGHTGARDAPGRHLSQRQLAGRMQVPRTYISKIENGKAIPTLGFAGEVGHGPGESKCANWCATLAAAATKKFTTILSDPFLAEIAALLPHLDSLHRTLFFGAVRDAAVGRRRTA